MSVTQSSFLSQIISNNPVTVFTHRQFPSSGIFLGRFDHDGIVAHEVPIDHSHAIHGTKGEPQLLHELSKLTGRPYITDAVVFVGGNFIEDVGAIADLRGFCSAAGAKFVPVKERHVHHVGMGPWQAERGD
jgi:hypothetical protein